MKSLLTAVVVIAVALCGLVAYYSCARGVYAHIYLETVTSGATVWIDDVRLEGVSPIHGQNVELSNVRLHTLHVGKSGYRPFSRRLAADGLEAIRLIELEPEGTPTPTPGPAPPQRLVADLISEPPGASVRVDGIQLASRTPLLQLALEPRAEHRFEFTLPGYEYLEVLRSAEALAIEPRVEAALELNERKKKQKVLEGGDTGGFERQGGRTHGSEGGSAEVEPVEERVRVRIASDRRGAMANASGEPGGITPTEAREVQKGKWAEHPSQCRGANGEWWLEEVRPDKTLDYFEVLRPLRVCFAKEGNHQAVVQVATRGLEHPTHHDRGEDYLARANALFYLGGARNYAQGASDAGNAKRHSRGLGRCNMWQAQALEIANLYAYYNHPSRDDSDFDAEQDLEARINNLFRTYQGTLRAEDRSRLSEQDLACYERLLEDMERMDKELSRLR